MAEYAYFDADTGEQIYDVDPEVDEIEYDDAQPAPPPEEEDEGWDLSGLLSRGADYAKAATLSVPARIARAAGGGLQALEENTGLYIPGYPAGSEIVNSSNYVLGELDKMYDIPRAGKARMAYELAGNSIPAVGSLLLSGGASAPFLAEEALRNFGDVYQGLRQKEVEPLDAAQASTFQAGINALLGKFSLDKMMGPGMSMLGRSARGAGANLLTTPVGTGTRLITEQASGAEDHSWQDVKENLAQDAVLNVASAALLGPAADIVSRKSGVPTRVDTDSLDDLAAYLRGEDGNFAQVDVQSGVTDTQMPPQLPAPEQRLALPAPPEAIPMDFGAPSGAPIELPDTKRIGYTPTIRADQATPTQQVTQYPLPETVYTPKDRLPDGPTILGSEPPIAPDVPQIDSASAYRARTEGEISTAKDTRADADRAAFRKKVDVYQKTGAKPAAETFPKPLQSEPAPPKPEPKPGLVADERGSIDITPFRNAFDNVMEAISPFRADEVQRGSPSERYFQGYVGRVRVPGMGTLREQRRLPSADAEKFPAFREAYDIGRDRVATEAFISHDVHTRLKDYWALRDRSRVNRVLASDRENAAAAIRVGKAPPPMTEERLRGAGLNDAEIKAYASVRGGMDVALNHLEAGLLADAQAIKAPEKRAEYEQNVKEYVQSLRKQRYVPFSRFGKNFDVVSKDANGKTLYREFFNTRGEAARAKRAQDKIGDGRVVEAIERPSQDLRDLDVSADVVGFNPGKGPLRQGFGKHLIEASLTPGYNTNIDTSIADYVLGLSRYSAKKQFAPKFKDARDKVTGDQNHIRRRIDEYVDFLDAPADQIASTLLRFSNAWVLAGVPSSATTNLTQSVTTTYPKSLAYVNPFKAGRIWASSEKSTWSYLYSRAERPHKLTRGLLKNPESKGQSWKLKHGNELHSFLDHAIARGTLEAQAVTELSRLQRGYKGPKRFDFMFLFKVAEEANRVHAMTVGYKIGQSKGLKGTELYDFSENFMLETQFDQSQANMPKAMRNPVGRVALQFKPFLANYMHFIRKHTNRQDWPVAAASIGAMIMLGGVTAVPGVRELRYLAEGVGFDPIRAFRRFVQKPTEANAALYGTPTLAGINMSGAVGLGELIPQVDRGVEQSLARTLGGPVYDNLPLIGPRWRKAYDIYKQDEPWIAAETIAPRALRGPSKALRAYMEGSLKDARGNVLLDDPSTADLLALAGGWTPQPVAEAYEERHSADLAAQGTRDNDYYNLRIGKAFAEGREEDAQMLILEMMEKGLEPNSASIGRAFERVVDPNAAQIRSLPAKARPDLEEIRQNMGR